MQDERTVVVHSAAELVGLPTRRGFLKALGLGGTLVLMPSVFAACADGVGPAYPYGTNTNTTARTISLGTDVGIFTFAYALEQLESKFYETVVALPNFSSLFSAQEQELLVGIRNDEVTHREFMRQLLGASFPDLTFNFASVTGSPSKTGILTAALTLETNGIAAYNGAGYLLKNANNLLVAGKIVSVEARHTSAIADALDIASGSPTGKAYADLTASVLNGLGADPTNALDAAVANEATIATNAQPFIVNTITLTA